jgi:hypothetical protein
MQPDDLLRKQGSHTNGGIDTSAGSPAFSTTTTPSGTISTGYGSYDKTLSKTQATTVADPRLSLAERVLPIEPTAPTATAETLTFKKAVEQGGIMGILPYMLSYFKTQQVEKKEKEDLVEPSISPKAKKSAIQIDDTVPAITNVEKNESTEPDSLDEWEKDQIDLLLDSSKIKKCKTAEDLMNELSKEIDTRLAALDNGSSKADMMTLGRMVKTLTLMICRRSGLFSHEDHLKARDEAEVFVYKTSDSQKSMAATVVKVLGSLFFMGSGVLGGVGGINGMMQGAKIPAALMSVTSAASSGGQGVMGISGVIESHEGSKTTVYRFHSDQENQNQNSHQGKEGQWYTLLQQAQRQLSDDESIRHNTAADLLRAVSS